MTTDTATKPEAHRWLFFAAVLATFLLLSMLGNAAHVWADWHADVAAGVDRGRFGPWVPTIAIGVAPSAAMVMCEMVVISYRRNTGWARAFVTLASALVGLIALVVSYVGLVYVWTTVIGLPVALGYVAPLVIDVPIVASTVGMWDVLYRIRRDRETAEEQAAESVEQAPYERPAATGVHPDADDAVTDEVVEPVTASVTTSVTDGVVTRHGLRDGLAAVGYTDRRDDHDGRAEGSVMTEIPAVVNKRHDGPRHAADQPRRSVTTDREAVTDAVVEPVTERVVEPVTPRDVEPVTPVVTDDDAPVTEPVTADHDVMTDADEEAFMRLMTESLTPVTEAVTEAVTDGDAPVTEPVTVEPSEGLGLRDLAELVHAEMNPQASVGDVEAVLQERQGGASYKAAGAVAEVSEATARRWVTAAERLGGQPLARR